MNGIQEKIEIKPHEKDRNFVITKTDVNTPAAEEFLNIVSEVRNGIRANTALLKFTDFLLENKWAQEELTFIGNNFKLFMGVKDFEVIRESFKKDFEILTSRMNVLIKYENQAKLWAELEKKEKERAKDRNPSVDEAIKQ